MSREQDGEHSVALLGALFLPLSQGLLCDPVSMVELVALRPKASSLSWIWLDFQSLS